MRKPRILLVTKSRDVYNMFCDQLKEYFRDSLELLDGERTGLESWPDLVLGSYREIVKESRFPLEKLIVARRTIDLSKTGDLVALPSKTKCLVVNNGLDTALETILCLENLGLDLELHPYNPAATVNVKDFEVALVAETGRDLVPQGFSNVVYIGMRPIDYATILEIAFRLQIPLTHSQGYSSTYIRKIVALSGELSRTLANERDLNRQMDAIFHTVHDGLIAVERSGVIVQANQSAYKILGLDSTMARLIGRKISDVFPESTLTELSTQASIHQINDTYLVINQTNVDQGRVGSVLAFQDVTRLQKLEQDFRKRVQAKGLISRYSEDDIISTSNTMERTLKIMRKIAPTDRTILILGESGTGKELIAHTIHRLSGRSNGPFLPVNFAGLPETLAESELFGYEDGAFTGARRGGKPGLFELAHNGTLFLDEIGDASPAIQALLLRVLQEGQVMRVGGDRVVPVDVRIIAATNRNLEELVHEKKFRHDLYYRLCILPLHVPSLRERTEDIPLLMTHFVQHYSIGKMCIPDDVMECLVAYDWPGNVRELEAAAQYITSVAEGDEVTMEDLPNQFWAGKKAIDSENHHVDVFRKGEDLHFFFIILDSLMWAQRNGLGNIGRNTVVDYAARRNMPITEQQVRSRMTTLRRMGLIEIGSRRQGSSITKQGESALQSIRVQHPEFESSEG